METHFDSVRVAAVADLHCSRLSQGEFQPLFAEISASADVLVMCGDLTNLGQPEEARVLARELAPALRVPALAVLGNHDFEAGYRDEICRILADAGVTILDGDGLEVRGIGFAGVKGFAGGFGQHTLEPWGEEIIKRFVKEAMDEALKLESALARLQAETKIALLHYAPIAATVVGEPLEVYPFLGSSRLEDPVTRYPVRAIFHGHAHHGSFHGSTRSGIPVYNVALPLLRQQFAGRPPFHVIELEVPSKTNGNAHAVPVLLRGNASFGESTMNNKPQGQGGEQHPPEWRRDLNPAPDAGQNYGLADSAVAKQAPTAYDLKDVHAALRNFTDDQLKEIPVLLPGSRLEQGATYLDLRDPERREFTATGDMAAGPDTWLVPKSEVSYTLWNRLRSSGPEPLDEADEP